MLVDCSSAWPGPVDRLMMVLFNRKEITCIYLICYGLVLRCVNNVVNWTIYSYNLLIHYQVPYLGKKMLICYKYTCMGKHIAFSFKFWHCYLVFRFQIICQFNVNCQCKLMDNNIFSIVILLFNSIQFNFIVHSWKFVLFACLHKIHWYIQDTSYTNTYRNAKDKQ